MLAILIVLASCVAAVPYLMWFLHRLTLPQWDPLTQVGTVGLFFRMPFKNPELTFLVGWFYDLASFVGLVTCAFSILLALRSLRVVAARLLSSSLASLGIAFSYFYYLRVFPEFGFPSAATVTVLADFSALTIMGMGIYWIVTFFANYPTRIDVSAVQDEENRFGFNLDNVAGIVGKVASFISRYTPSHRLTYSKGLLWWQITLAALMTIFVHAPRWFGLDLVFVMTTGIPAGLIVGSVVTGFGACWGGIRYNYRHSLPDERRQIEWIYVGVSLIGLLSAALITFVILMVLAFPKDMARPVIAPFFMLAPTAFFLIFMTSILISIFYRGNIDPNLAIRKSSLLGFLGLFLGSLFVGVERFVARLAVDVSGLPDGTSALFAVGVIAVAFGPARKWLDVRINSLIERLLPATHIAEGMRMEAAVSFSDLSGFTSLTAENERLALTLAGLLHKEARRITAKYRGRVVKTIGDAVLCQFPDSKLAVEAVTALHVEFSKACLAMGLPKIGIHSGIHYGEIVQATDGDIYGAIVNLAARLQAEAADNEIITSAAVRDGLNQGGKNLEALGERVFKNVPGPVSCFRFMPAIS